jgi:hypothetical protein
MNSFFKNTPTRRFIKDKEGRVIGIGGWGYYTCTFCNQKVISYNDERHTNSQKHKENVAAYEKKNSVIVIENIDKVEDLEALLREKKLI